MKNNRISNLAEFRRWVKIRLVEKEISQNELARQMGIPHARISEAHTESSPETNTSFLLLRNWMEMWMILKSF